MTDKKEEIMRISVFGLGYVGCVTSVCLAKMGHEIKGVDVVDYKINDINEGISPIEEEGIHEMLRKNKARIKATKNVDEAISNTDLSFICVGTPPKSNGDMDFSAIEKTCFSIGDALSRKKKKHTIIVRSTMFPGSFDIVKSILEQSSGKKCGKDFYLLTNPEFLREGTAIKDFFNPPIIIIGAENETASQNVASNVLKIFKSIDCDKWIVSPNIAQMIKYVNNSWHALKVSFANEIGALCHKMNIDSKLLMEIFCQDTQLNLSPYYLKPGFAWGGSCLGKESAMLKNQAIKRGINAPLLNSISKSNLAHIERAIQAIKDTGKKKIGILGISFKPGTDDLRGNPILLVINRLQTEGYDIKLYDPIIGKSNLEMLDLSYRKEIFDLISMENLREKFNYISKLFAKNEREVLKQDVIIIANRDKSFAECLKSLPKNKIVLDLQNIYSKSATNAEYRNIV